MFLRIEKGHTLVVTCPFCRKERTYELTDEEVEKVINMSSGDDTRPVQEIFPDWDTSKREALINGVCDECWG